jgi:hypothetical protein
MGFFDDLFGDDDPPAAPDYSPIMNALTALAEKGQQMSSDQFDWFKQQYAENKEIIDSVTDRSFEVSDFMMDVARRKDEQEVAFSDPLKEQAAIEAENYATPERIEMAAGEAEANVAQQMQRQRDSAAMELEKYGIDPSDTRQQALNLQGRAAEAAVQVAAGNSARKQTEQTGRDLRDKAIGYFSGNTAATQSAAGQALQAGNQAVNANLAGTATAAQTTGTPQDWSKLAMTGYNNAGDLMSNMYKTQMAGYEADQKSSSGFGEVLGALTGGLGKVLFKEEGGMIPSRAEMVQMAQQGGEMQQLPPPPGENMPGAPPGGDFHDGMPVPPDASPSQGGAIDDVPARLNVGEFVVPKDVVRWHGEKFFQNLIQKARKEESGGGNAKPQMGDAGPPQQPTVNTTGQAIPV